MQTEAFVASPIPSCLVGIDLVEGLEHKWQRHVLRCIPAAQTRPAGSMALIQQWPRELCNEKSVFRNVCHSFSMIAAIIQKTSACETVEHFMFTALILPTTTRVIVVMEYHKRQVRMNFQRYLSLFVEHDMCECTVISKCVVAHLVPNVIVGDKSLGPDACSMTYFSASARYSVETSLEYPCFNQSVSKRTIMDHIFWR